MSGVRQVDSEAFFIENLSNNSTVHGCMLYCIEIHTRVVLDYNYRIHTLRYASCELGSYILYSQVSDTYLLVK